jgi:hypothetical protein
MDLTIFEQLEQWLRDVARRRFWLVLALMALVTFLYVGVGIVPKEFYRAMAQDPFKQRTDIHQENYFQESPLLPVLGFVTGWHAPTSFALLCCAFIAAGYVYLARASRRRYGPLWTLLLLALLLSNPVTVVLLSWIGMPDAITFLVLALLLYVRQTWGVFLLAGLGAYNHPIALFAVPSVLLLRWLARESGMTFRQVAAGVAGVAAGWLAVRVFLNINNIEVVSRAEFIGDRDLVFWIKYNLTHLPVAVFSLQNMGWFALAASFLVLLRLDRVYAWVLLGLLVVFYGITFFCLDTTRVFALLAWAPAWHGVVHALQKAEQCDTRLRAQLERALIVIALIGLLSPTYYVWLGQVYHREQNAWDVWTWLRSLL